MTGEQSKEANRDQLPAQAQARLNDKIEPLSDASPEDVARLVEELQTHQIELEMQNEELRRAQKESEGHFHQIATLTSDWIWEVDADGLYTYASPEVENLLGYRSEELVGEYHFYDMFCQENREETKKLVFEVFAKKEPFRYFLSRNVTKTGEIRWLSTSGIPIVNEQGILLGYRGAGADISEKMRSEKITQLFYRLLKISNGPDEKHALLDQVIRTIRDYTGCDAVAIRVLDGEGNIPYEAQIGFSDRFFQLESPLSLKTDNCMCINVIKGDADPELPFYTDGGSFWTNGTTRLLATVSEEEKGQTRNVCNEFGYESVALIPMRLGDRIVGLIHVADRREDQVPPEMIETLETVACQLSPTIQRIQADEKTRETLKEKELLLREIQHRVKNNMQVIDSLLKLQSRRVKDKLALEMLAEMQNRIKALALVHDTLYQSRKLTNFDLEGYIKKLGKSLTLAYGRTTGSLNLVVDVTEVIIDVDKVVQIGLILNELLSNCFKHAFPNKRAGRIRIASRPIHEGNIELVISDDGIGLPQEIDLCNIKSVGLDMVIGLVEKQLGGSVEVTRAEGTQFTITFKP